VYDVETAVGSDAGLELIRNRKFDVIVSDQRMPGLTGVELLRLARDLQPNATRLLLTGYSDLGAIISSINEGEIFRFVTKPWSNTELRGILAAAVEAAEVPAPTLPPALTTPAEEVHGHKKAGVLLLDDDAPTRSKLKHALNEEYPVYEAKSVDESLDLLAKHAIGVVITELVIGGEMLTDLLVALRQYHPALVIVVLTAYADAKHSITLINQGQIYRLLIKPVSDSVLRGTVNIAGRRYEMLQQHPEQIKKAAAGDTVQRMMSPERIDLLNRISKALHSD
jgi:serine/threonine-protein kinase